mmetsp:Transcript_1090/g.2443  ORF Transcript_1090/g.2443 Transcript_1090/m.2443 type:complete len:433 (-) Transcript_1090:10-1308(-)
MASASSLWGATRGPYKIMIINDYSPEETHGISVHFLHLVRRLRERGHTVVVFTTSKQLDSSSHRMWSITNVYNPGNRMGVFPGLRFYQRLFTEHWDLIHVVYPTVLPWFVLPFAAARSIPTYCSHHVDLTFYNKAYNSHSCVAKCLENAAACCIYVPTGCFGTTHAAPTYAAMRKEKPRYCRGYVDFIPTSIDKSRFFLKEETERAAERAEFCASAKLRTDDLIVLMVSRLAPEKGQEEVLQAFDKLVQLQKDRPWQLVLVGDGPSRSKLESIVETKRLPVTFLGMLPNETLPPIYRSVDCFVTCSMSETFGITVLEAIACGCPVVMPRMDVFEELYGSDLGDCMYDKNNGESMAKAIHAASSDEAKARVKSASHWKGLYLSWEDAVTEQEKQYAAMITEYNSAHCCGRIGPKKGERIRNRAYTASHPDPEV